MQRRNARGFGHWIRLNVLDVWQVLGTIGLIVGTLTFGILIANGRQVLPATGSAVRLVLQTLVPESPHVQPTVEPTPSPTPAATEPAPAPSAPRVPIRVVFPSRSQPPAPTDAAAPTPVPIATPTPTDRPCLYALCPTPSPLP